MNTSKKLMGALLLALGVFVVGAATPELSFAKRHKAKLTAQERQTLKAKRAEKKARKKAMKAELKSFRSSLSASMSATDKSKAVKSKRAELRKKYAKK